MTKRTVNFTDDELRLLGFGVQAAIEATDAAAGLAGQPVAVVRERRLWVSIQRKLNAYVAGQRGMQARLEEKAGTLLWGPK